MDAHSPEKFATGFPEDGRLVPIASARIRVSPDPHPVYLARRAEIEANWQEEVARNPHLYNGALILLRRLSLSGDRIEATGHEVPYATHLWWRRQPERMGAFHAFSWAVPISSDGALIAIRMGPATANPGLVYCAAGSLEPEDVFQGEVDLKANMAREVREETGLDLAEARADEGAFAALRNNRLMMCRLYRFPYTAEEIIARVRTHMVADHEQEIDDVIAIRNADPAAHRYGAFMPPLLEMIFGRP